MPVQVNDSAVFIKPQSETSTALSWHSVCHLNYTRDTWVKLVNCPDPYSFDEAMLLCPSSQNTWVAWIPEYGEILLDRGHFYVC